MYRGGSGGEAQVGRSAIALEAGRSRRAGGAAAAATVRLVGLAAVGECVSAAASVKRRPVVCVWGGGGGRGAVDGLGLGFRDAQSIVYGVGVGWVKRGGRGEGCGGGPRPQTGDPEAFFSPGCQ